MKPLSPFQIPLSGTNLIEASAGTGKTYNIASLYVRSLIEKEVEVKDILVVTYTEAATKELRERLMRRLRQSLQSLEGREFNENEFLQKLPENVSNANLAISILRKAIRSFDEAAIYTIHGFCYQALQEQAFESCALFDAELIGDDTEVARQVIDDYWRNWVHQITEHEIRRPLLKYLLDKGYHPDSLTAELSGFIGKPYLEIIPEKSGDEEIGERLNELSELFAKLKGEWQKSREQIFKLLDEGHLSYYRTDWLQGWMVQMHEWIYTDVPPIELFDKFDKFVQTSINNSLKKSSEKKGISPPEHPFFKLAESYMAVAESLQDFDITFKLNLFRHLRERLNVQKEELQLISYDDLLIRLRDALVDPERGKRLSGKLRKAYPIALVDEFQDTDPVQYEIFRNIYGGNHRDSSLFMIGDPKQSIYSFRGADIFAYLEAKNDAPKNNTYSLSRNFRSVPELLSAINQLFSYQENPFILKNIPFHPVEPGKEPGKYMRLRIDGEPSTPIEFRELHDESDELPLNKGEAQERSAQDTAEQISRLLRQSEDGKAKIENENVQAADIAVLVRSHYQADLVRKALHTKGINSVQYSQDSVFDTEEADELQRILKAVADPANEGFVRTALATNIMGYTATGLLRFEEDELKWVAKLEQFSEWHDTWQSHGFGYMFRKFMKDEEIAEKLIKRSDGERKLTNLVHLSELLQQKEKGGKTGTRSLIQWLARKRNEDRRDQEEEQLRLESDENLVRVVTMHRSKGLEYPIVFCPFLWHGAEYKDNGHPILYHDPKDNSRVYLDFHGKGDPERNVKRFQMAKEELAESVRLAYVAITRAEQKCVISWVQAKKTEYSPLGYLLLGREKSFEVLEQSISAGSSYSSVNPDAFTSSLEKLISRGSELYSLQRTSEPEEERLLLQSKDIAGLQARSFQRSKALLAGPALSSFSSLIANKDVDFDMEYELYGEVYDEEMNGTSGDDKLNIFNFPKGPNPGTAVHHIFEEIDFTDLQNLEEIVDEKLERHNIDQRWMLVVSKMVKTTLNKKLWAEGLELRLADIDRRSLIPELEFYFTMAEARLMELLKIIRPKTEIPASVSGYSEQGYMKGFIDLIFKYKDRYYILDYKTNHLGDTVSDYNFGHLQDEMKEAMYDLQYHIYVLALHRYLQNVDPKYTYEKNFGGVFYLFLRGLNHDGQEGIYFELPESSRIEELHRYLQRERQHG